MIKEWWSSLMEDAEERYEAEFEFMNRHPFIGYFFFEMKWMFIIYFAIIIIMAYATGKVWDLVEKDS